MNIPDEAVEAAARAMAILDDYDGCFLEVDAWNALEDWERDAYPENYPGMAIEDCAYWLKVAKTGIEAAAPHLVLTTHPTVEWVRKRPVHPVFIPEHLRGIVTDSSAAGAE